MTWIDVNFLDIDTSKFSFEEPKPDRMGGAFIPIRYDGKYLYVTYESLVAPFGISKYGEKLSLSLTVEGEYLDKAKEIDEFFIDACTKYAIKWGISRTTFPREFYASKLKQMVKPSKNDKYKPTIQLSADGCEISGLDGTKVLKPFSIVDAHTQWSYIHRGQYGVSYKPKCLEISIVSDPVHVHVHQDHDDSICLI